MEKTLRDLLSLGWDPSRQAELPEDAAPGRVAIVERGRYFVIHALDANWTTCTGRLLNEASDARDLPVVGDWVALRGGVICAVLPRASCFVRKAAGEASLPQPICANVSTVFIVTAVGVDLNPRRLERYVAAVRSAGAAPVIVINKCDLQRDLDAERAALAGVAAGVPVAPVSAHSGVGLEALAPYLGAGATVALVGSSGVGKSSLVNRLLGEARLAIGDISDTDGKGQHTTTRRELLELPGGALIIDTPGMREFGLWEAGEGLHEAFADIQALARECHYRDCSHEDEPGCAVLDAIECGVLAAERLASYHRLDRELAYQERRADEATRHKSKQKWKAITKSARVRQKLDKKLGLKGW